MLELLVARKAHLSSFIAPRNTGRYSNLCHARTKTLKTASRLSSLSRAFPLKRATHVLGRLR